VTVEIRAFELADLPAVVAISNRGRPRRVTTVPEARRRYESWNSSLHHRQRLVAATPDGVVGWGEVAHRPWQFHPDRYDVTVEVDPRTQRAGIGTGLLQDLVEHLERRDAELVRSVVGEDEAAGLGFLTGAGFAEVWRNLESRLDIERFDAARWSPVVAQAEQAGISITNLAAETERDNETQRHNVVLREIYDLYQTADSVELDPVTVPSFGDFVAQEVPAPHPWTTAWTLARHDGVLVGLSTLEPIGRSAEAVEAGFTIVHPAHRRRGIALALKVRTIAWAREHGFRWIETDSNAVNLPMLRLNALLGFEPLPARITLERRLR
jgi:GNAT superfamily N-acetyltransferase